MAASGDTGDAGDTDGPDRVASPERAPSPDRAASPDRADSAVRVVGRPRDERASGAITAAALSQLARLGYAGMSMDSVATEAGVGRATVYRRYRDKADLVTAAVATKVDAPPSSQCPLADLIAYLDDLDARVAEPCLEVIGSLLGAREDPAAMALHRERVVTPRVAYLRSLLTRAVAAGLVAADADLDVTLDMLLGAVFARRIVGVPPARGWAARAVAVACQGVATPAGRDQLRGLVASGSSGVRLRTKG